MILRQIELYIIDGKIVLGNEYDALGEPAMMNGYIPLSAGAPYVLIVTDDGSRITNSKRDI